MGILHNGRDHYNSISAEVTVYNTKSKIANSIYRPMHSKSKLWRKIEQTRNRKKKNSKLNEDEHAKRRKKRDKRVVEIDSNIVANGHRAHIARSVPNTLSELCQTTESDKNITSEIKQTDD